MIRKCNRFVFKWIALLAFLLNLSIPVFSFETKAKSKLYNEDLELVVKSLDDKQSILSEVELDEVEEDIDEVEEDIDGSPYLVSNFPSFQSKTCFISLSTSTFLKFKATPLFSDIYIQICCYRI